MRARQVAETLALRGAAAALGALPWQAAQAVGAGLGSAMGALGVRRRVARENLALSFPEQDVAWRERVLAEHYRELGRVVADYVRMPRLARAPRAAVFARIEGETHLRDALARRRGVVFLSGHFGSFEVGLVAIRAFAPFAVMVKPLSNPGAEAWLSAVRRGAGMELLPIGLGVRAAIRRLRAGGAVALLGDQDARRDGVFVPFLGRLASTPTGPAWLSLATGAPIVFGTTLRERDGRFGVRLWPPLLPEGDASDREAVRALTARHAAMLEAAVRERPEAWFWLHKRWKTRPDAASLGAPTPADVTSPPPAARPSAPALPPRQDSTADYSHQES
jgi:KDO2-lipid IV(A) lauroyltransferase